MSGATLAVPIIRARGYVRPRRWRASRCDNESYGETGGGEECGQDDQAAFSFSALGLAEKDLSRLVARRGHRFAWLAERSCGGRIGLPGYESLLIDATILVVMTPVKPPEYGETALALGAVDRSGEIDLHEQVAAEIRRAIADGEAGPGDRIPQAKDLAAVLGVHTNTVLRALRMLRDEGLLETGRGRAITVAGTPERGLIVAKMKELVELSRLYGYRREELISMMERLA